MSSIWRRGTKPLLLPTSSGLVDEAFRQRKCEPLKPLGGLRRKHSELYFLQLRLPRRVCGVKKWPRDATLLSLLSLLSLSRLRLNCNKMESTAEICSPGQPRADQWRAEYGLSGQSAKRQPDAFTPVARAVTSIAGPPPASFVGARVFPERSGKITETSHQQSAENVAVFEPHNAGNNSAFTCNVKGKV